ncbi:MAG: hypothetical protein JXQ73_12105 [Phycisphaerae bacterium]|nr:hypothetical protein [Phycisphaerae bacterium]
MGAIGLDTILALGLSGLFLLTILVKLALAARKWIRFIRRTGLETIWSNRARFRPAHSRLRRIDGTLAWLSDVAWWPVPVMVAVTVLSPKWIQGLPRMLLFSALMLLVIVVMILQPLMIHRRRKRFFLHLESQANMLCPDCHYRLDAHRQGGRCPECAYAFTPESLNQDWADVKAISEFAPP